VEKSQGAESAGLVPDIVVLKVAHRHPKI